MSDFEASLVLSWQVRTYRMHLPAPMVGETSRNLDGRAMIAQCFASYHL
jgi:hypothetical protein